MTRFTRLSTAILVFCFVKVSEPIITGYFEVKCPYRFPYVYWIRDSHLVMETSWSSSPRFTEDGNDLQAITNVSFFAWGKHKLQVNIGHQDNETNWQCCIVFFVTNCNDVQIVKGSPNGDGTVTPPSMPTDDPDEALYFNAKLKLTSHPGIISEGQQMTLICTISNKIDEDKWSVIWIRNDTPVFITDRNSSLSSAENLTDELAFPHDGDNYEDILHSLDDVFSNINVTSDTIQQKVVIPVSSSLIGWSLWNCANPYVANLSNTLILEVKAKTTPSDHRSMDTKTTPTSTGLGHRGNKTSSTTYIIAGSVGGVVVLVLIVKLMIVLRMRRRKEKSPSPAEADPDAHVYSSVTPYPRTESLYSSTSAPQPLYENTRTSNQAIASDVNVYYNTVYDRVII